MDFALYRVFLTRREQGDLFGPVLEGPPEQQRERWLRNLLSQDIKFTHRRNEYFYVPIQASPDDRFLSGRIGRKRIIHEASPPDQGLEDTERPQWQAVLVAVDPTMHEDGQKIAIQKNFEVGRPDTLLKALIEAVNSREPPEPFLASVNPITDAESFWDFARANKGAVTSITFDVSVPNMFGGKDNFQNELRAIRDKNRAQKARIQLQSAEGLDLDTDSIKEAVEYTARGGGETRARAKGGKKFRQKKEAKSIPVEALSDDSKQKSPEAILKTVFDDIFGK